MDKRIDKDGNWKVNSWRVEKDKPKVAVSYALQEDEAERGKVKFGRLRNGSKELWRQTEFYYYYYYYLRFAERSTDLVAL